VSAAGTERQLIVFSLHGEQFGLPITTVREITRYTPLAATVAAAPTSATRSRPSATG
jgi:chemotaxis signal transduction protein